MTTTCENQSRKKIIVVIGKFLFLFHFRFRRSDSKRFSRHITIKFVLFSRLYVDTGFQRRTTTFCRGKSSKKKICFSIQKIHFLYNRKINSKFHQPNVYHLYLYGRCVTYISWQVIFFSSFHCYYYIIPPT